MPKKTCPKWSTIVSMKSLLKFLRSHSGRLGRVNDLDKGKFLLTFGYATGCRVARSPRMLDSTFVSTTRLMLQSAFFHGRDAFWTTHSKLVILKIYILTCPPTFLFIPAVNPEKSFRKSPSAVRFSQSNAQQVFQANGMQPDPERCRAIGISLGAGSSCPRLPLLPRPSPTPWRVVLHPAPDRLSLAGKQSELKGKD